MPRIQIEVPHQLGREIAIERLKNLAPQLKEKYPEFANNIQEEWDDQTLRFSFGAFGASIVGETEVQEASVQSRLELPMAAMILRGRIEKTIREELESVLAD